MGNVIANMSVSLDGFVGHPVSGVDHLHAWYGDGDVAVPTADGRWTFQVSAASAKRLREAMTGIGALVTGRKTFDEAQGWDGNHPLGTPVFVVTHHAPDDWAHPEAPFTFVTDGVASAIAQAKAAAGDKDVAIGTADLAQQAVNAGLVDVLALDLVPVLLGDGTRFFGALGTSPVKLSDPQIVQGDGVTHVAYRVLGH